MQRKSSQGEIAQCLDRPNRVRSIWDDAPIHSCGFSQFGFMSGDCSGPVASEGEPLATGRGSRRHDFVLALRPSDRPGKHRSLRWSKGGGSLRPPLPLSSPGPGAYFGRNRTANALQSGHRIRRDFVLETDLEELREDAEAAEFSGTSASGTITLYDGGSNYCALGLLFLFGAGSRNWLAFGISAHFSATLVNCLACFTKFTTGR